MVGSSKHAGGDAKAARKQPKKLMLETKPSSMGRRVQPVVDAALRAKVEAAAAKKRKDQVYQHLRVAYCSLITLNSMLLNVALALTYFVVSS
jgi:hypothetical protein